MREAKGEKLNITAAHIPALSNPEDEVSQGDTSDEGWQEAVPKGRFLSSRKASGSKRPSLAKLNTNSLNNAETTRYRVRPTSSFSSPRTSPNEVLQSSDSSPVSKKLLKSSSFSPKPIAHAEKSSNAKSAPATPAATTAPSKTVPLISSITIQSTRKALSYKEVALAPPGTIVKAVEEQQPKEKDSNDQDSAEIAEEKDVETNNEERTRPPSSEARDETGEIKYLETSNIIVPESSPEAVCFIPGDKKEPESTQAPVSASEMLDCSEDSKGVSSEPGNAEESELDSSEDLKSLSSKHIAAKESQVLGQESAEKECEGESSTEETPEVSGEKEMQQGDESLSGDDSKKPVPREETVETVKERSKKLSAAAAPFNPSTVPVFGSVVMTGSKEHGGILPPPVNVPPMMTMSPVRKHPHQSATARVPYGPRLAGGYGRSGRRGPRNKPGLQNGEIIVVDGGWSAPRIMNPNAAEFVPGQPWTPNGYPVSPNGTPISPDSSVSSPTPVTLPILSDVSEETPMPAMVGASENSEVLGEGDNIEKDGENGEEEIEKQNVEAEASTDKNDDIETELNSNAMVSTTEVPIVVDENPELARVVENPGKCW